MAPGFFGMVTANSTFTSDWTASVRGRFGVTSGPTLLYGTAGIAFAGSSLNAAFLYSPPANALLTFPGLTGTSSSRTLTGWTAGAGAE